MDSLYFLLGISSKYIFAKKKAFVIIAIKITDKFMLFIALLSVPQGKQIEYLLSFVLTSE